MEQYLFGIDVGGTTVKCGLFRRSGELLEKWEIPTRTEENGRQILPDVAVTIRCKIQERNLKKEEIAGVGIGVPGPVMESGEVPGAVNIHWGYKNVAGELTEALNLPVRVGNDANVAALGEMWQGGGRGSLQLRQQGMPGAVCVGDRHCASGEKISGGRVSGRRNNTGSSMALCGKTDGSGCF